MAITARKHKTASIGTGPKTGNNQKPQRGNQDPSLVIDDQDRWNIADIYAQLQRHQAQWVGPSGQARDLPPSAQSFFLDLLEGLGQGKTISVFQAQTALSTIQASELLGVSRRFLVGLLENEQIPFHWVGTHRRIYARDLFRYKAQRDGNRSAAIRELARAEQAEGLYDQISPLADDDHQ